MVVQIKTVKYAAVRVSAPFENDRIEVEADVDPADGPEKTLAHLIGWVDQSMKTIAGERKRTEQAKASVELLKKEVEDEKFQPATKSTLARFAAMVNGGLSAEEAVVRMKLFDSAYPKIKTASDKLAQALTSFETTHPVRLPSRGRG